MTKMRLTALELQHDRLPMWVVYDHPLDYPDGYVARLHFSLPEPTPTALALGFTDLDTLRIIMAARCSVCLARDPDDDPVILETWVV